ncbi:peptidoglycan-binding protein [Kytococcus sedentarius]|uniref:C40 family peptidase n=1 Tax=Kytococcus sedentarius TaxID=1276 RepID=UPI0035BC6114
MGTIGRRSLLTGVAALGVGSTGLLAPAHAWDISRLGPTTLRPGDRGAYVQRLQWAVNKVGDVTPKITLDGVYGTQTTRAVRAFQSRQRLHVDGIAGAATKQRLDALLDEIYPDEGGNAPDLLQPVSRITPVRGGNPLRPGWAGTRVKLVLRALGVNQGELSHRMTPAAVSAVRAFQRRRGLAADGVVGPATWRAFGFNTSGYRLDGWQQQPRVGLQASVAARIEAMIAFARQQRGADYTWGGAGPYKYGYDCSGLVLQSMYAAGVQPSPLDVLDHQSPGFRTTQQLYRHSRLRRVPLRNRRRGDLTWYTNAAGAIQHVSIYLGDGYVVDSLYSVRVRRDGSTLNGYRRLGTVSRVFA